MFYNQSKPHHRRRGAVIVFVMVMLVTLIGFASLTVDVGALFNTRADLQNAADAAALSAVSSMAGDDMLQIRIKKSNSCSGILSAANDRAGQVALHLGSFGMKTIILDKDDVQSGWIDLGSATSDVEIDHPAYEMNAVHVVARRSTSSSNGPLTFFFASIFGKKTANVSASATAAFDDRVGGYDPGAGGADLFPITIKDTVYDAELAKNTDGYEYDGSSNTVSKSKDGVPELNLYPISTTAGNFGLLNIGIGNGTGGISKQIKNGVPPEDLQTETGSDHLNFYDDDGDSTPTGIHGTPGLKASLEDDIKSRIGDIVAVPIHSGATGSGANTKYNVVGVRFARIMAVSLKSDSKYLWIQPVSYSGRGLIMNSNAPGNGGAAGQVVLVR